MKSKNTDSQRKDMAEEGAKVLETLCVYLLEESDHPVEISDVADAYLDYLSDINGYPG